MRGSDTRARERASDEHAACEVCAALRGGQDIVGMRVGVGHGFDADHRRARELVAAPECRERPPVRHRVTRAHFDHASSRERQAKHAVVGDGHPIHERDGDDADLDYMQAAIGLIWRALVLWLFLILLATIANAF